MNSNCIIYSLKDPVSNEVRYIGKSKIGMKRPKQHLLMCSLKPYGKNKNLTKKQAWIKSLINRGLKPIIEVICSTSEEFLDELEIKFIKSYTNLTNMTKGGDGATGHVPWNKGKKEMLSKETIQKMSDSKKGHVPWNKGFSIKIEELNESFRNNMFKKGNIPHNIRKVINIDTKEIFESGKAAANSIGTKQGSISRVCLKKRKTINGFRFMFLDEYEASKRGEK